jgi:peptide/nickel transport system permease protein
MTVTDFIHSAPRRFPRRRFVGLAILIAMACFAVVGPWLIGVDPLKQDLRAALSPPGDSYTLGADHLGRSMAARLAHAARLSLGFGLATVLTAAVPGVFLGLAAAWFGGFTDRLLSGLCDAVMALPGLLLVLIIAAFAPGAWWPLFLGLALALWVEYFRLVRTVVSRRLAAPDVEAARLFGFSATHIARRHLLPELWPALATLMAFGFATVIVAISTLSFVGVGMRPPTPEWGSMMTELLPYHDEAPLQVLMPALCLFITVLGLQLSAAEDGK